MQVVRFTSLCHQSFWAVVQKRPGVPHAVSSLCGRKENRREPFHDTCLTPWRIVPTSNWPVRFPDVVISHVVAHVLSGRPLRNKFLSENVCSFVMQMLYRSSVSCIGGSHKFLQYHQTVSAKACSYWPDVVIPQGLNFSWQEILDSKAVKRRPTVHERYMKSPWAAHDFYKGELLEDSEDEAPPGGYVVVDAGSIVEEPVDGAVECVDSDEDFTVPERGASSSRPRKRMRSTISVPTSGDDDFQIQGVGDRWNGDLSPRSFRESDARPSATREGISDVDGLYDGDDDDDLQIMEADAGLSQAPLEDIATATDALMDEGGDNSSAPDGHCAGTFLNGRSETSISQWLRHVGPLDRHLLLLWVRFIQLSTALAPYPVRLLRGHPSQERCSRRTRPLQWHPLRSRSSSRQPLSLLLYCRSLPQNMSLTSSRCRHRSKVPEPWLSSKHRKRRGSRSSTCPGAVLQRRLT